MKKTERDDSESVESLISLQESSTFLLDVDESYVDVSQCDITIGVTPENIKEYSFLLVKFEKKIYVVYYVDKVLTR